MSQSLGTRISVPGLGQTSQPKLKSSLTELRATPNSFAEFAAR